MDSGGLGIVSTRDGFSSADVFERRGSLPTRTGTTKIEEPNSST